MFSNLSESSTYFAFYKLLEGKLLADTAIIVCLRKLEAYAYPSYVPFDPVSWRTRATNTRRSRKIMITRGSHIERITFV